MSFSTILNPVLTPVLIFSDFWSITIISFIVAIITTLIYRWMTDRNLMRTLKSSMIRFQSELKLLKDDPDKMMVLQKKVMKLNMQYMAHSIKPTLISLIPILFIIGWLGANFKGTTILNLFGWKISWLGSYILLSATFSITLRGLANKFDELREKVRS